MSAQVIQFRRKAAPTKADLQHLRISVKFDGTQPADLIRAINQSSYLAGKVAEAWKLTTEAFMAKGCPGSIRDLADMNQHAEAMVRRGESPRLAAYLAVNFPSLTGKE